MTTPQNPYDLPSEAETRQIERIHLDGTLLTEIVETMRVDVTGAREITKTELRTTGSDGRAIDTRGPLQVCNEDHAIISGASARTCWSCMRVFCGAHIKRWRAGRRYIEVCRSCRRSLILRAFLHIT
jgi:hypothetical protein